MAKRRVKVAVTGAAGQIGYAFLFRIASGQMFGQECEVELQLLELEQALPALKGVAMELEDCAFPLLKNIVLTSDLNTAFKDANWVVCVGSVPRKEGMERSDLLKINGGIFTAQAKAVEKSAASDVRIFVVGNPCNTNALIAMNNAKGIPADRFFAMTTLDENRAKAQLAIKAQVDITAIKNMTIWGNHSATQYPDFFNAKINGRHATEVISDHEWLKGDFIKTVQQRGASIIKARGLSSAASAANAAIDAIRNIVSETPIGESYSMCLSSNGEYGVDKGLIFSYPCRTEGGKVKVIEGLSHNEFGQEKFKLTLDELRGERDAVKSLNLI